MAINGITTSIARQFGITKEAAIQLKKNASPAFFLNCAIINAKKTKKEDFLPSDYLSNDPDFQFLSGQDQRSFVEFDQELYKICGANRLIGLQDYGGAVKKLEETRLFLNASISGPQSDKLSLALMDTYLNSLTKLMSEGTDMRDPEDMTQRQLSKIINMLIPLEISFESVYLASANKPLFQNFNQVLERFQYELCLNYRRVTTPPQYSGYVEDVVQDPPPEYTTTINRNTLIGPPPAYQRNRPGFLQRAWARLMRRIPVGNRPTPPYEASESANNSLSVSRVNVPVPTVSDIIFV